MLKKAAHPYVIRILSMITGTLIALQCSFLAIGISQTSALYDRGSITGLFDLFYALPFIALITAVLIAAAVILGFYRYMKVRYDYYSLADSLINLFFVIILSINMSAMLSLKPTYVRFIALINVLTKLENYRFLEIAFAVLGIACLVYNVVIFMISEGILKIHAFIPDHVSNDSKIVLESGRTLDSQDYVTVSKKSESPVRFFRTIQGLLVIFLVGIVVIGTMGYMFYDQIIDRKNIDLGTHISVKLDGKVNGQASIDTEATTNADFSKYSSKVQDFVDNIEYSYSKKDHLKNGDKVVVTAHYDHSTANQLRLHITSDHHVFKIDGLIHRYRNKSQIPHSIRDQFYYDAVSYLKTNMQKTFGDMDVSRWEAFPDSMWFMKYGDEDRIVMLYKVDYYLKSGETDECFVMVQKGKFNSDYFNSSNDFSIGKLINHQSGNIERNSRTARRHLKIGLIYNNEMSEKSEMIESYT